MNNMYEGRSINKLQNGAIPSVLKTGKIRNIRFVGNLILNIHTFLDDDVIIVTSSDNRTQSICVLFSPSVYYRNSQVYLWNDPRITYCTVCWENSLSYRLSFGRPLMTCMLHRSAVTFFRHVDQSPDARVSLP